MNVNNGGVVRIRSPRKRPTSDDPWWLKNAKQHPLKSTSALALVFGGFMLMMFFGHLQELPDIDLASSASLLWALAAIGALVAVFVLALPLLPGLDAKFSNNALDWAQGPAHQLALSLPALVTFGIVLIGIGFQMPNQPPFVWALLVAGTSWISIDARRYFVHRTLSADQEAIPTRRRFLFVMVSGMFTWWLTLGLGFIFVVTLYLPAETDGWWLLFVVAGQLGIFYSATLAGTTLDWRKERAALAVLVTSTLVLPALISQNVTGIAVAAVRTLGLGERPARLVLTSSGCDAINKAAGQKVCETSPGTNTNVVCPAILKSRIGTPYLIELSPLNSEGTWPERKNHPLIPIAKAEVVSWPKLNLSGQVADSRAGNVPGKDAGKLPSGSASAATTAAWPLPGNGRQILTYLDDSRLSEAQRAWLHRECPA
jgi:hypothetical protein